MNTNLYIEYEYQVGGSLRIDAPSYVARQADHDLYTTLRLGQFCYVLNCRQMGKSSLRVRTMQCLKSEGTHCIAVDMTRIGTEQIHAQQWYEQFISELWRGANLLGKVNLKAWFQDHADEGSVQLLARFIEEVLLTQLKNKIVIFIDEIDSILSLKFSINDFFAFIRSCYNQRVDNSAYERLTFCLLGVATPSDLMTDKTRTPFNIGRAIALNGFQFKEAQILAVGLVGKVADPEAVLQKILCWTGGQPFLTQKICQLVAEQHPTSVEQLVLHLIHNWISQDEPEHLRTIRDRLLRDEKLASRLLGLYRQILQQGEIAVDDSAAQQELRMSGLVVRQGAVLKVYNPIYAKVFNQEWVDTVLNNLRPYAAAFNAWIASNQQDESRLLRGRALEEALQWSAGRDLSSQDAEFLRASQATENQETKQANQILAAANRKAKWRLRVGTGFLGMAVVAAGVIGLWANRTINFTKTVGYLEIRSREALEKFEYIQSQALFDAMRAAYELKQLNKTSKPITHPTSSPIVALNSVLNQTQGQFATGNFGRMALNHPQENLFLFHEGNNATVWDWQGNRLATLSGHQAEIQVAAFSPNGQMIATAAEDCSTRLWNLEGKQLAVFQRPQGAAQAIQFSPDSQFLIVAEADQSHMGQTSCTSNSYSTVTTRIFDLSGKQKVVIDNLSISYFGKQFNSTQFSPKSDRILTIRSSVLQPPSVLNPQVQLWNFQGRSLATFKVHTSNVVEFTDAQFSPDGESIAMIESNGVVTVGNLQGKKLVTFKAHSSSSNIDAIIRFSPNGQTIATGTDGVIQLWNRQGQLVRKFRAYEGTIATMQFSPDGQKLLTAGNSLSSATGFSSSVLWDLQGNRLDTLPTFDMPFHFSADGQRIISANAIWHLQNPNIKVLRADHGRISAIKFNPEGNRILTYVESEGVVRVWDNQGKLLSGFQVGTLVKLESGVAIKFDATADRILTLKPDDEAIRVWNLQGKQVAIKNQLPKELSEIIVNQQWKEWNQEFAAEPQNNYVEILQQFGVLKPQIKNEPGDRIATFEYGNIAVLDAQDNQLAEYNGYAMAFSPDGEQIAVVSGEDNTPRIYRVDDLDGLLKRGCDLLRLEITLRAYAADRQMCGITTPPPTYEWMSE